VSAGTVGWPEDVLEWGRDLKDDRFSERVRWLLVATPTLADPSRAPEGMHTVKLLGPQTWATPEGRSWDEVKEEVADRWLEHVRRFAPNLTDDKIAARLVKSPEDIERSNPHMIHGSIHGGDRSYSFSGKFRPVPGWASHRMPIPGLYQTGGTTSVGGSITGIPGRHAAIVMLRDLGISLDEVVAGGGRARVAGR
jgi:phytoene dehydrogenase-like protein